MPEIVFSTCVGTVGLSYVATTAAESVSDRHIGTTVTDKPTNMTNNTTSVINKSSRYRYAWSSSSFLKLGASPSATFGYLASLFADVAGTHPQAKHIQAGFSTLLKLSKLHNIV